MKANQSKYLYLLFLAVIMTSCASPKKKKEDVGFIGRAYQNMTAYYNGYFNADEIIDAAILQIEAKHPDNFQNQLVIYPYLLDVDSNTAAGTLNVAIEKLKKDIYLHQASHWVDDSYFQMGKSQFLKKDFEKAENSFKYVVQNYSAEKMAKEKLKKMSPKQKKKAAAKKREEDKQKRIEERAAEKAARNGTTAKTTPKSTSPQVSEPKSNDEKSSDEKIAPKKSTSNKKLTPAQKKKAAKKKAADKKKAAAAKKKASAKKKVEDKKASKEEDRNATAIDKSYEKAVEDQKRKDEAKAKEAKESASITGDDVRINYEPEVVSKPKKYILKHRPVFQEAQLWLAKTYIQRGNLEDGSRILRSLKSDAGTFDFVRREALLTEAMVDMDRGNAVGAIPKITAALPLVKDKKRKARLTYILGQLYASVKKYDMAYAQFEAVEKLKPSYEMTFNARLSKYSNSLAMGNISNDDLNSNLRKMLKDLKNEDYKDQIYFLMADVNLKNNDVASAIKNLQAGIQASKKGAVDKSDSYLKLADLFYGRDEFDLAYHYYDSTGTAYPNTKPRYSEVLLRRDNLKDIALNIETINYQDSILRISLMSPEQQEEHARKLIKAAKAKEKLSGPGTAASTSQGFNPKFNNNTAASSSFGAPANINRQIGPKPTTFFAYNEKTVKDGKKLFEKSWGKRPLVDNWRYSALIQNFVADEEKAEDETVNTFFISKSEITKVLSEIPKDVASTSKVEADIMDAMIALGGLYPDKIDRSDKTIEILEELLKRFPNNRHEPQAMYQLYFAYMSKNDKTKADYYANILKTKYSGNPYSLYFSDPEYIKRLMSKDNELQDYYSETFNTMDSGNYVIAYDMATKSDSIFGKNNLMRPKFAMISAMALGNLQGKEAYIAALKDLINTYPNSEEEKRAKEMMRLLGTGANESEALLVEADKIYKINDQDQHFVMIIMKPEVTRVEDVKIAVSDYNNKFFNKSDLKIANITLKDGSADRQVLLVRSFDNKIKAMEYYNQARNKKSDFISARFPFDIYAISNSNYRELLRLKSPSLYDVWFTKYYRNM